MANELTHKDPGVALTQAEFIASDGTGHVFESQASGDILYASSSTVLSRLARATDGNILELASGLPAWTASPSIGSTSWANANHAHAASNSGGTLTTLGTITTGVWNGTAIATAYIGADAITGAKIADDAIDSEHYTDGSIDTAHLAADAVTGAKIADDALDSEHYTDGSIDAAHLAADAVTAAKIGDDVIDSEHYADGSIDTAHIADNQVTAAKLADIARGSIIYGNASAATAELTKGGANTVLTSDGTDISWATPAAGGSLVLINTAAASDSASLTITGLDSTYDTYLITGADLRPASDDPRSYIRLGDSSGIDSGASDYGWHSSIFTASSTSYNAEVDASAAQIQLSAGVGNATGEGSGFALWLHCPGDSLTRPIISGTHTFYNSSTAIKGGVTIAERTAVIAVDRVQFFFSSGNISTGRLTVWGLAHA